MRQITLAALTVILSFGLSSCAIFNRFFGGGAEPPVVTEPVPVPVDPQATPPTEPGTEEFPDVVVEEGDGPVGTLPLDLIPSTDPNSRVAQIERERSDPFALLPTAPSVEIPVQEAAAGNGQTTPPGGLAPIPELVPNQPPPPPPPPQPELARAVEVTGVIQLGNVPYAIVNAPNEPHSRYVRAGQRLSNDEVLVKRIEMIPGSEPVVVFEQFGIEVVRAVGTGGPPEGTETAAIAVADR